MAAGDALSHPTEQSSLPFLLPFMLMLACGGVGVQCSYVCTQCIAMSMHVFAEARGKIQVSCFSTPYSLVMGSLPEPGSGPVTTKPQLSSCLCPAWGSQNRLWPYLTFYLGAGYPLCHPQACSASLLTSEPCLAFRFVVVSLFPCPTLPCPPLCAAPLYMTP